METLVQIAKRLGIKPNPNITDEAYLRIKNLMFNELQKMGKTGLEQNLDDIMYRFHKKTPSGIAQQFDKASLDNNLEKFKKEMMPGVSSFDQEGAFWWHSARKMKVAERFVADVKLDDPNISAVFKKLDTFILRHQSGYKVSISGNRTDTLNLYMPKEITPQLAREFYEIVKPVLQTKNHTCLDGFPIIQNGKEIQGIKFGPEPLSEVSISGDFRLMKNRLESLFPRKMVYEVTRGYAGQKSLGQVAAKAQLCDFLYYLVGKEGQNPIQLGNQLGNPNIRYSKKIDISQNNPARTLSSKPSNTKHGASEPISSSHLSSAQMNMSELLKSLQQMTQEVRSMRSETQALRQSNAQMKQTLVGLCRENLQLRENNRALRSSGAGPKKISKGPRN